MSFKYRIIFLYTGLLFLVLAVSSLLFYTLLDYGLRQEVEEKLSENTRLLEKALSDRDFRDRCNDHHFLDRIIDYKWYNDFDDIQEKTDDYDDKYLLMVFCGSEQKYRSRKYRDMSIQIDSIPLMSGRMEEVNIGEYSFLMYKIQKKGYSVCLGYDLSSILSMGQRTKRLFLFLAPLSILLSFFFGWLITRRSFKHLNSIIDTAGKISHTNLSRRIKVPRQKDEIQQLIITLNSMINRLEKSFNTARQFSQDAAHEIRTPLTIMRGQIEELITEDTPEEMSASLESILEEVTFLSSIVNKLLLLHSLDQGGEQYGFTESDLVPVVERIREDIQILAEEKNIQINYQLPATAKLQGSEELLSMLVWNLLENSIKYSAPETKVELLMESFSSQILLTIADEGMGIPKEEQEKIFNRFYRLDKSHSRSIEGSGLGLAIVKWIADLHQGQISLESAPGKGSRFTIAIPVD